MHEILHSRAHWRQGLNWVEVTMTGLLLQSRLIGLERVKELFWELRGIVKGNSGRLEGEH